MRVLLIVMLVILALWGLLTLIVERTGDARIEARGAASAEYHAWIVYDPDPIYNLDERVSIAVAEGLAAAGWSVSVRTVAAAREADTAAVDLYVLCANTYNWSPDWAIGRYVRQHRELSGVPVAAITLGSGSTARAQRRFDQLIEKRGAYLLDSRTWWLLRPNDEDRMEEPNARVAADQAEAWGTTLAQRYREGGDLPKS
jgi:hypothetical protein